MIVAPQADTSLLSVHRDAFSSGQISSKLWLCEELERVSTAMTRPDPVIWILGGWHGLLGFLLLSRGKLACKHLRSFDIDPSCAPIADAINENWIWKNWRFKAFTSDANSLDYRSGAYGDAPDIVINTAVEHFDSDEWWERIPSGTLVALQACDLEHEQHSAEYRDIETLRTRFPLSISLFSGALRFDYPDLSFNRWMTVGKK